MGTRRPAVGEDEQVLCMAMVEPQLVMTGSLELLRAVGDQVVEMVFTVQVLREALEIGPVWNMVVSPTESCLQHLHMTGACFYSPWISPGSFSST